jgi:DNA-binding transcriptional MerR regulator
MTATVTRLRPERPQAEGLTAPEVCDRAHITYRQLDYWTRVGVVHALGDHMPGTGHFLLYGKSEARVAATIKQLLDAGFVLRPAVELARQLVETGQPVILAGGLVTIVAEVAE